MGNIDGVDLDRINELAKKKKTEGLTQAEAKEQSKLRKAYLDLRLELSLLSFSSLRAH